MIGELSSEYSGSNGLNTKKKNLGGNILESTRITEEEQNEIVDFYNDQTLKVCPIEVLNTLAGLYKKYGC